MGLISGSKKHFTILSLVAGCIFSSALPAQTVISDTTYNPVDWSVQVVTEFGASEIHEQRLTGGNPGAFRYMEHILPAPPGANDLARVETTHIYEGDWYLVVIKDIDHIDYAEDFRLLNLQWNQAFIVSYPALRQGNRLFRATEFLSVIGDTLWHSGGITGLTADDFIALDGSGTHPDFSGGGDFLNFGFWRISTRSGLLPPIPANQNLVYEHGSDNFTVTIYEEPPENRAPNARTDEYLYLDYFVNAPKALNVLENDSDPDGDPIRVASVDEPPFGGNIVSFNNNTITYSVEAPLKLEAEKDFFTYRITDGEDESAPAFVNIYFCACPIQCISLFLAPPPNSSVKRIAGNITSRAADDTLNVELFRQFRDDLLLPTETGSRFVDFYYDAAPEVMPLLIFDRPDLGLQAMRALQMMQDPVRDLLEAAGTMAITQTLVDGVGAFLDSLNLAVSDSLRDVLQVELARLGPLQDLVGLSVAEAVELAIGDSVTTRVDEKSVAPDQFVLGQNYPNPFNPGTTIRYSLSEAADVVLAIFDIQGRTVKTLVKERQPAGNYRVVFDASGLASGVYFYRLQTDAVTRTRKMLYLQ